MFDKSFLGFCNDDKVKYSTYEGSLIVKIKNNEKNNLLNTEAVQKEAKNYGSRLRL